MISGDADYSWGDFDADDSIELLLELLALDMGAVLPIAVEGSSMMDLESGGTRVAFLVLACDTLGSA